MNADQLIVQAWESVHPSSFVLWNSFTPVDEDARAAYPIAEFVPTGYAEDSPLSNSSIRTHRYQISITDTSKSRVWDLARITKRAIESIQDELLVESSAELDDFATPWDGGGRQIVWEMKMNVSIMLYEKG